jgi:hypothetical protein
MPKPRHKGCEAQKALNENIMRTRGDEQEIYEFPGKNWIPTRDEGAKRKKENVFNNMLLPRRKRKRRKEAKKANPKRRERQIAGINANLYTIYSSGRLTSPFSSGFFFFLELVGGRNARHSTFRIWEDMNKLGHELSARVEGASAPLSLAYHDGNGVYSQDGIKVDNKTWLSLFSHQATRSLLRLISIAHGILINMSSRSMRTGNYANRTEGCMYVQREGGSNEMRLRRKTKQNEAASSIPDFRHFAC